MDSNLDEDQVEEDEVVNYTQGRSQNNRNSQFGTKFWFKGKQYNEIDEINDLDMPNQQPYSYPKNSQYPKFQSQKRENRFKNPPLHMRKKFPFSKTHHSSFLSEYKNFKEVPFVKGKIQAKYLPPERNFPTLHHPNSHPALRNKTKKFNTYRKLPLRNNQAMLNTEKYVDEENEDEITLNHQDAIINESDSSSSESFTEKDLKKYIILKRKMKKILRQNKKKSTRIERQEKSYQNSENSNGQNISQNLDFTNSKKRHVKFDIEMNNKESVESSDSDVMSVEESSLQKNVKYLPTINYVKSNSQNKDSPNQNNIGNYSLFIRDDSTNLTKRININHFSKDLRTQIFKEINPKKENQDLRMPHFPSSISQEPYQYLQAHQNVKSIPKSNFFINTRPQMEICSEIYPNIKYLVRIQRSLKPSASNIFFNKNFRAKPIRKPRSIRNFSEWKKWRDLITLEDNEVLFGMDCFVRNLMYKNKIQKPKKLLYNNQIKTCNLQNLTNINQNNINSKPIEIDIRKIINQKKSSSSDSDEHEFCKSKNVNENNSLSKLREEKSDIFINTKRNLGEYIPRTFLDLTDAGEEKLRNLKNVEIFNSQRKDRGKLSAMMNSHWKIHLYRTLGVPLKRVID